MLVGRLLCRWLLTLNKSKNNLTTKLPWEKLDAWTTFWATYPCHGHSTVAPQTWKGHHRLWALPQLLLVAYFCWLFQHPVSWFTPLFLTQSFRVPLVIYPSLCSAYVTYRMPCHVNGHQANSYLGTRKISLGVAIILSICLCLYTYNHS